MHPRKSTNGFVAPRRIEKDVDVGNDENVAGVEEVAGNVDLAEDEDVVDVADVVGGEGSVEIGDMREFGLDMNESVADVVAAMAEMEENDDEGLADESDYSDEFRPHLEADSDLPSAGGSSEDDEEWIRSRQKIKAGTLAEKETECDAVGAVAEDSDDDYVNMDSATDDEGEGREKVVAYKVESDDVLKNFVWKVGMRFSSAEIFKTQVCRYGALSGYCVKWVRSNKDRLEARCKEGCAWRIYAGWDGSREHFMVKTIGGSHSCNRQDFENAQVTPSFIAKEFLVKYKRDPGLPRKQLQDEVLKMFGK